jgi:hypothetical protein
MRRLLSRCAICAASVSPLASKVFAQSVADTVVTYNSANAPTTFGGDPYNISSGALGLPTADTTFGDLTPFNAPFDRNQIVGIGDGGSLVLHMSQPLRTNGFTLGIHAAVGLIDTDFPNGHANSVNNAATPYTDARAASVSVSQDGLTWKNLGTTDFDAPTNFYSEGIITPGFQSTPGLKASDFFKPFTGTLADFANKDWPGVLTALDGSAGGEWLDLSATSLSEVNFVRFDVTGAGNKMYVDSVVGVAVPEPSLVSLAALSLVLCRRRK